LPLTFVQKKVGTIAKDSSAGPFIDEWKKAFGDLSKEVEEVDITSALSVAALAVKDENELVSIALLPRDLGWLATG
jgi:nucleosome binding factor SPN SPT16 subunit